MRVLRPFYVGYYFGRPDSHHEFTIWAVDFQEAEAKVEAIQQTCWLRTGLASEVNRVEYELDD